MSSEAFEYLDLDDLLLLAAALLGGPPPVRDLGLLAAAVARPKASAFGDDAYPDVWSKAAALLHSIVKNHALVDGNKRLGYPIDDLATPVRNAIKCDSDNVDGRGPGPVAA